MKLNIYYIHRDIQEHKRNNLLCVGVWKRHSRGIESKTQLITEVRCGIGSEGMEVREELPDTSYFVSSWSPVCGGQASSPSAASQRSPLLCAPDTGALSHTQAMRPGGGKFLSWGR